MTVGTLFSVPLFGKWDAFDEVRVGPARGLDLFAVENFSLAGTLGSSCRREWDTLAPFGTPAKVNVGRSRSVSTSISKRFSDGTLEKRGLSSCFSNVTSTCRVARR